MDAIEPVERPKTLRVVILGRPNVGKSTLFNRLAGKRKALVHDLPGVTRDRIEERVEVKFGGWQYSLHLIDTGGVGGDTFSEEIEHQVKIALQGADLALLVTDAQSGVLPQDQDLVRRLAEKGFLGKTRFVAVVNKVDDEKHESWVGDFYSLGIETVLSLSAEHRRGIDELSELMLKTANDLGLARPIESSDGGEELEEERPDRIRRIAIVGRPNVGKSTLVNRLIGQNRMITSAIAGTTTDAVDVELDLGGKRYLLADTAGVRRRNKTEQGIEVLSIVQTRKAIERADIVILVLDGEQGISDQDEKIAGMVEEAGASVILAMNKWDTQRNSPGFTKELAAERIRGQIAFMSYAPIIFISAKDGTGLEALPELVEEILHQRQHRIPTHEFTEWVREEATIHNPENAKFFLCHQSGKNPPTFVLHVNDRERVHFSLRRHFVNVMRERWGYMGTPIRLLVVEGKNRRSLPKKRSPRKENASGRGKKYPR